MGIVGAALRGRPFLFARSVAASGRGRPRSAAPTIPPNLAGAALTGLPVDLHDKIQSMRKTAIIIALLIAGLATPVHGKSLTNDQPAPLHRASKPKAHAARINCLPPGTNLNEVVSYGSKGNVTVQKKLAQLQARCRNRKLVDAKGREIRFHRPSCWGNPPADYMEIQQRENEELVNLRKTYTVIVFGCNPLIQ